MYEITKSKLHYRYFGLSDVLVSSVYRVSHLKSFVYTALNTGSLTQFPGEESLPKRTAEIAEKSAETIHQTIRRKCVHFEWRHIQKFRIKI